MGSRVGVKIQSDEVAELRRLVTLELMNKTTGEVPCTDSLLVWYRTKWLVSRGPGTSTIRRLE